MNKINYVANRGMIYNILTVQTQIHKNVGKSNLVFNTSYFVSVPVSTKKCSAGKMQWLKTFFSSKWKDIFKFANLSANLSANT